MLRTAVVVLALTGLTAGAAVAQDGDVGTQIEQIRQKVRAAAVKARAAQEAEEAAREEASKLLEGLGKAAIPHLLKIVENADQSSAEFDPDFVARARAALERLGWVSPEQKEQMAEMLTAIKTDDFDPLEDAFAVLECGLHAVNELDKALQGAEFKKPGMERQRRVMLKLLGELAGAGRFEALPALVRHLGAPDAGERVAAGRALIRAGDQPVNEMTGEPDAARIKSLDAAVTKHGVVAPLLALATHGSDNGARVTAADALGSLKRKDAAAGLAKLAAGAGEVAAAAGEALAAITGQSLEGAAWAKWVEAKKAEYPAQTTVPANAPGK